MNKNLLLKFYSIAPKTTEFFINIMAWIVIRLSCSNNQARNINDFISSQNFVYKFRFSHWLVVHRFKFNTLADCNFRPFTSLDKIKLQSPIKAIHSSINIKPSKSNIHRITQIDLNILADFSSCTTELRQIFDTYPLLEMPEKTEIMNDTDVSQNTTSEYNLTNMNSALQWAVDLLNENHIDYFLMSGTLLGLVRDKKPLRDDDIDIGIYANQIDFNKLNDIIQSSDVEIDDVQPPYLFKLKKYGVSIDLFYHFKEGDEIWHGSIYHRWYNAMFEHTTLMYNNNTYSVPNNHDIYLRENYGDWKTPVTKFSIYLDCPNYKPQYNIDALVFLLKNMIKAHRRNDIKTYLTHQQQCLDIFENI